MRLPRQPLPSLPLLILCALGWSAPGAAQGQPSVPAPAVPAPAPGPAVPPPGAPTPPAPASAQPAPAPAPAAPPPAPAPPQPVPAVQPADAGAMPPSAAAPQPPAAAGPQPSAAAPQRAPSFLDAHPTGLLPPVYARDERRHLGFSVRLSAGAGYGWARRKLERGSTRVHGLDGLLSLDVGAAAQENLIVYGRFAGFGWNQLGDGGSANAGSAYAAMLGAGARYYLQPLNLYGSATVALALLKITNDLGKPQNAKPGFGLDLEIGRDFWAGTPLDRRAIGVGLRFGWVHAGAAGTGQANPKPWNAFALSFVFSVGYN